MGVQINRGAFDDDMRRAAMTRAHRIGQEIVNEARQRAPVDEGRLRASIDYTATPGPSKVTVSVGSPVEYAAYVHEGTGVYGPTGRPIVPVSGKVLKFKPKGGKTFLFRPRVQGSPPKPFLADALQAVLGNLVRRNT